MKIIVNGKPSHSAYLWLNIDPIVVSAQIVNSLQTNVSQNVTITENPAIFTIGSIRCVNRDNIISKQVETLGTNKTFSDSYMKFIYESIWQIVIKKVESAGTTAKVFKPYSSYNPVTFNDNSLTFALLPSLQKLAGVDTISNTNPDIGNKYFLCYQYKVPSFYFFIGGLPNASGAKNEGPHLTPQFIIVDSSLKAGVNAFYNLILDCMKPNRK
jgi:amidohydrolase